MTGTVVIGEMALGKKLQVSAAVLVAAAIVYFVVRTATTESARTAEAGPLTATDEAELQKTEAVEVPAFELPTLETTRQRLVAEEPPVEVAAVTGAHVLRVVLKGLADEDARAAKVTLTGLYERAGWPTEIQDAWPCQGSSSDFDLDPFFAAVAERDADPRVDELELTVDHPLHLLETTRIPLSSGMERESGQTVYEVSVRLVPACVIHGRLTREDGTPVANGLVGALMLEEGFPVEDVAGAVACAADGAFELRLGASGPHALASFEDGMRPTTTHVEALVGTRVDVGTLVLEAGHAITGHVLRMGHPATGASISSTPPRWRTAAPQDAIDRGMRVNVYEGRTFATSTRSVHLLWLTPTTTYKSLLGPRRGGRFELNTQRLDVDEDGAFEIGGLGSLEYLLRLGDMAEANASVGDWGSTRQDGMVYINGGKPALAVRAPEHGVVLDFRETLIRFELAGDLEREDEGRLVLMTRSRSPTPVDETGKDLRLVADPQAKNLNFMPEFLTGEFPLSGDEPTYILQGPPDKHMTGAVEFPGRQPVPLDFRTPGPGGEVVVPVELVRAEELATLVIELENPQAEIPETFTVLLWRAGLGAASPDTRLVEAESGQLRVDGLFPGHYRVGVRTGESPDYPTGLFFEYELELELLPGPVIPRSIMLERCAGLRVTVRDEDGALVGGEFELFDDFGGRVSLLLDVREGQLHLNSYSVIFPYGTHESTNPLQPGRYRLALVSPGYADRSVMVELRAGEYADVDVTLSR
jgi:hypothetical protein